MTSREGHVPDLPLEIQNAAGSTLSMLSGKVRGRREEEDLEAAGASQTKLGSLLTGHLFMDKDFCLKSLLTTHGPFLIPNSN